MKNNIKLPFKKVNGEGMVTCHKRGAVVNYKPLIINDMKFINNCYEVIKETKPEFFELVNSEYEYLKKYQSYGDLMKFNKAHPFWKKESNDLLRNYNELYSGFYNGYRFRWRENRDSKNNVVCNEYTCLSYLQVRGNKLIAVSRSLDIACGFKADLITLKLMAEEAKCDKIEWHILNPHNYVENMFPEAITMQNLLEMKPILKVRKGVS